jgi:hypothetical protein
MRTETAKTHVRRSLSAITSDSSSSNAPNTGRTYTKASDIDIDHIVPLSYAHRAGAASWSRERKRQFANDPLNLLSVEDNTNQSKGDKGPRRWMPPLESYHDEYMRQWDAVVSKYGLEE